MSTQQRKKLNQRRPGRPNEPRLQDMWKSVPSLPPLRPIVPSHDAGALLHSLGDPPLPGKSVVAGHYLQAVIERAAMLATALAASADLLGTVGSDEPTSAS